MRKEMTDEEVEREIEALRADEDVRLTQLENRLKARERLKRRTILYNLRWAKKHGEELREAGYTRELLYEAYAESEADTDE